MIKDFKVTGASTRELSITQDAIGEVIDSIAVEPFISGNIVKDVVLTTSAKSVSHKLGRSYSGFIVTKKTAATDVYIDTTASNPIPESVIWLKASVAATVDIYFF